MVISRITEKLLLVINGIINLAFKSHISLYMLLLKFNKFLSVFCLKNTSTSCKSTYEITG